MEYNMKNVLQTKCGGETSLRPGKSKLGISLDQQTKVL